MTHLLVLFGWNLLIAVPIALMVWLLGRTRLLRQRPALCHGLWLLVLLKLVTPPLVPVPVLPANTVESDGPADVFEISNSDLVFVPAISENERDSPESDAESSTLGSDISRPRVEPSRETHRLTWRTVCFGLLGASLAVSIAVWCAALRQFCRVRRLLRCSATQIGRAVDVVQDVSRRFALRSTPKLLIVDASITPLLWVEPGKAAIALPRELAESLDDDQLRNVIAHEIAHYVRRDHWANVFAFFVTSLFWWNPIAWFARRAMTNAAEASCDALALKRMACSRKSYAETLLAVVDFVTSHRPLRPTLAATFGESRSIKRRFEMIANSNVKANLPRLGWVLLVFVAGSLLLIPTRAQESIPSNPATAPGGPKDPGDPRGAVDGNKLVEVQPSALPPALRLSGFWSLEAHFRNGISPTGRIRWQVEKGAAAFTMAADVKEQWHTGLMTYDGERRPRRLKFRLTKNDDQLWIDVVEEGGEKLLGLCELSDDNACARWCFGFSESGRITKRPKSFEEANSKGHTIVKLKRINRMPETSESPAAKRNKAYVNPQHPKAVGPVISSSPAPADARPVPLTVPDNPLRGMWNAQVHSAGANHDQAQKMFAFFGPGFGLLSDFEGKSPWQFKFHLGKQDGQLLMDLTLPGDSEQTQYGICEVSKNKAFVCFCGDQYHTINGRPKSFKDADPKAYHKIILTRVSDSFKPSKSLRLQIPGVGPAPLDFDSSKEPNDGVRQQSQRDLPRSPRTFDFRAGGVRYRGVIYPDTPENEKTTSEPHEPPQQPKRTKKMHGIGVNSDASITGQVLIDERKTERSKAFDFAPPLMKLHQSTESLFSFSIGFVRW